MFREFSNYYLGRAKYELIENGKTYYGEIPQLKGVWATGKTLEECRNALVNVIEGWVVLRLKKNLSFPNLKVPFGKISLKKDYA